MDVPRRYSFSYNEDSEYIKSWNSKLVFIHLLTKRVMHIPAGNSCRSHRSPCARNLMISTTSIWIKVFLWILASCDTDSKVDSFNQSSPYRPLVRETAKDEGIYNLCIWNMKNFSTSVEKSTRTFRERRSTRRPQQLFTQSCSYSIQGTLF